MAPATRMRRAIQWLASAGVLTSLPACATVDDEPVERLPPPYMARHSTPAIPKNREIVPASAQVKPGDGAKPAPPSTATFTRPHTPPAIEIGKPLPIDLPTALALSSANPLDIAIAGERLRAASAQLERARVLWLPNLAAGIDYFRHDGQIQDVVGTVFTTSKSSFLLGAGPTAVFSVGDACYAPLAARQVERGRRADEQASRNDVTLQVAESYFTVQQARGEVAGAIDTLRRAEELVKLTEKVAPELTPTVEVNRARTEAARRRLAVESAFERWQIASAELTRLLRLEPGTVVEPAEEPALAVELIAPSSTTDELIPLALTYRPELASDQAVIQAALARVKQEKIRPLVPNVAVRGVGSTVPGLAGGYFGGGLNDAMGNFGARFSVDIQAVWEVQNLGFGNRGIIREREAEQREALLRLLRTQDRVTAEVVQAHAQLRRAANRVKAAEDEVANALETAEKNLKGLVPGKRVGEQLTLIFRPQEAVAAVAALDQAYRDYYSAIGDQNRAQFRLYRALGHPAQGLTSAPPAQTPPATMVPAAPTTDLPVPKPPLEVPRSRPEQGSRGGALPQFGEPAPVSVYPAKHTAEPVAPPQ